MLLLTIVSKDKFKLLFSVPNMLHRFPTELLDKVFELIDIVQQVRVCCSCKTLLACGPKGCMQLSHPPRDLPYSGSKPPAELGMVKVRQLSVLSPASYGYRWCSEGACWLQNAALVDVGATGGFCNLLRLYDQYWKSQMPRWMTYQSLFDDRERTVIFVKDNWRLSFIKRHTRVKLNLVRLVKSNTHFVHEARVVDLNNRLPEEQQ